MTFQDANVLISFLFNLCFSTKNICSFVGLNQYKHYHCMKQFIWCPYWHLLLQIQNITSLSMLSQVNQTVRKVYIQGSAISCKPFGDRLSKLKCIQKVTWYDIYPTFVSDLQNIPNKISQTMFEWFLLNSAFPLHTGLQHYLNHAILIMLGVCSQFFSCYYHLCQTSPCHDLEYIV